MTQEYKNLLIKILTRKAKGYNYREKIDEYVITDGEKRLVKTRVTTKRAQPDVAAAKALLEFAADEQDVTQMTDEQLQVEKLRLLRLLKACENDATVGDGTPTDET